MRVHPQQRIVGLIQLRKQGYSINELVRHFQIPKTTIWHHVHSVKISKKYQKILREKRGGSKKRREKAVVKAQQLASELLSSQKYHYPSSLLAMLYWAEGNKKDFIFTNTDPRMICMFIGLIRNIFNISHNDIVITIRYFTGMNEEKCTTHWADAIKFPRHKIRMYYNDGGNRGKSPFGICRVTVKRGGFMLKVVRSLIEQITPLSFNG